MFEGEYLNGKELMGTIYMAYGNSKIKLNNMKGKGKEINVYNGEADFEGEYLNGQRNGIGKEYDSS